jgi:lysozyme
MDLSDAGLTFISAWESERDVAYQDQAGIWTIGFGHTGGDVSEDLTWTTEQSLAALMDDTDVAQKTVNVAIEGGNISTAQHEYDAMVSLAFNIGSRAFLNSSVCRFHRAGKHSLAGSAFLLWDKYHLDGKLTTSAGLKRRRQAEMQLYAGETAAVTA